MLPASSLVGFPGSETRIKEPQNEIIDLDPIAHILEILLQHGHSVRITVRTEEKAQKLLAAHSKYASQLDYVLVPDIAETGCFDEAVKSDPPFEAIIHTASPFHYKVTDPLKQLMEPAVQGTLGVLQAAKKYAPEVKRIVREDIPEVQFGKG